VRTGPGEYDLAVGPLIDGPQVPAMTAGRPTAAPVDGARKMAFEVALFELRGPILRQVPGLALVGGHVQLALLDAAAKEHHGGPVEVDQVDAELAPGQVGDRVDGLAAPRRRADRCAATHDLDREAGVGNRIPAPTSLISTRRFSTPPCPRA
jgi:hypothetical protein